jgi:hypothetical protein
MSASQIPGLLDGWNEVRDKFTMEKDNFQTLILDMHGSKNAELSQWNSAVQKACSDADRAAHEKLSAYETDKKHMIRRVRDELSLATEQVAAVKVHASPHTPSMSVTVFVHLKHTAVPSPA